MRTERPTPWGFDVWDPRLTMRQLAASAQHEFDLDGDVDSDVTTTVTGGEPADSADLETVGAGVGRPEAG